MAGTAKTEQFMFSVATLMVGPQTDLLKLNVNDNSLGLVKNVSCESSPQLVELTQGIQNDVAFSAANDMQIKCSAEVYEFTARNIAYGLSLDASSPTSFATQPAPLPLQAPVAAAATTFILTGDQTTTFQAGKWGYLQEGTDDYLHIFKVLSSAYSTNTTVTITGYAVPTGMSFSTANGRAGIFNKIDANPDAANAPLACRITGTMIANKRPVQIIFPKIKITKGFSMKFANDNFHNLPFEFTPYVPLPTDPGYNADFVKRMSVLWP
ncbi:MULTISPECIES: hypothetical protein [unclassified Beijerinckia]|uniref:hypothetical protein n=1 Tax=unclassified Beijerinckia TaxID=2638183 RepID=UPI0008985A79|nr:MULTISPECIES: hypothetical protein [unclassified Beijerinckia]MDH7796432.1 hypothetical protein [Beijerinckia sp. GAS462]SEC44826.1 hypothetical protein SAMN05443249_2714 [Beijerinckia sp. 28-YEA-48]